MSDIGSFQARIGYRFQDEKLLKLALTHPSAAHGYGDATTDNQRLEFLGDAILSAVLSQELFHKFPTADEGSLTKTRAKLVNAGSLAARARLLEMGRLLHLSRGEENSGGRERASALTDAFEALLGAVFLDGGFEAARQFILKEYGPELADLETPSVITNPKGELQEWLQSRSPHAPQYHILSASGPDHAPHFECSVSHEGAELARGVGKSKKAAESHAAAEALKKIKPESPPDAPGAN